MREILIAAAVLALAWGMAYYYAGVLQTIRANAPLGAWGIGGYQSDLYPRWLGARELLLHHRNPYSSNVTREIELGFYGRPIDPARGREVDPEAFAYPVYVVFLLAPLLPFPFEVVRPVFTALLLLLTVATLPLWVHGLRLRLGWRGFLFAFAAMMSSYTAVEGIRLGQITLLVSFLMAGAVAALSAGWPLLAGILLALTFVKPQLSYLMAAFLLIWSLGEWTARKRLMIGFTAVMAIQLLGAEFILPGWFGLWRKAVADYIGWHRGSLLTALLGAKIALFASAGLILLGIVLFWRWRTEPVGSIRFNFVLVSALAVTSVVLPNAGGGSFYNQIVLLPALLWLFTSGRALAMSYGPARVAWIVAATGLAAEWVLAFGVSFAAFVLRYNFQHEATPFVGAPEVLMYGFPAELALSVLCAAVPLWRAHE